MNVRLSPMQSPITFLPSLDRKSIKILQERRIPTDWILQERKILTTSNWNLISDAEKFTYAKNFFSSQSSQQYVIKETVIDQRQQFCINN